MAGTEDDRGSAGSPGGGTRSARYEQGMRTRREVLGDAHVDRATAAVTDFDRDFQEWITESVWGVLWTRPNLDRRTRSLLTIAILAALSHEELELHLRASRNTGASPEDIAEALLHVAVYAGVPAANSAFKAAKAILAESPEGQQEQGPTDGGGDGAGQDGAAHGPPR